MKKIFQGTALLLLAILNAILNANLNTARAQGTAFTYQGRLNGASGPVSGSYV